VSQSPPLKYMTCSSGPMSCYSASATWYYQVSFDTIYHDTRKTLAIFALCTKKTVRVTIGSSQSYLCNKVSHSKEPIWDLAFMQHFHNLPTKCET